MYIGYRKLSVYLYAYLQEVYVGKYVPVSK